MTMERDALAEIATKAANVADGKARMELGLVLLRAHDEALDASATDLMTTVRTSATANVETPGVVAVDAKGLRELVSKLPDGAVKIEVEGDGAKAPPVLRLRAGKANYKLPTARHEDLPPIKDPEGARCTIDALALVRVVEATSSAMSTEQSRPHLCGVYIELPEGFVRATATDGKRVHLREQPRPEGPAIEGVLISAKGASLLKSLEPSEPVEIAVSAQMIHLTQSRATFGIARISESFPNCEKLFSAAERARHQTLDIDREELLDATRRLSCVDDSFKLSTDESGVALAAEEALKGRTGHEEVPANGAAPGVTFMCSTKYFTEALARAPEERIELRLGKSVTDMLVIVCGGYRAYVAPQVDTNAKDAAA